MRLIPKMRFLPPVGMTVRWQGEDNWWDKVAVEPPPYPTNILLKLPVIPNVTQWSEESAAIW
jgi:hypothetical protein